jgi:hypothetical protein
VTHQSVRTLHLQAPTISAREHSGLEQFVLLDSFVVAQTGWALAKERLTSLMIFHLTICFQFHPYIMQPVCVRQSHLVMRNIIR